MGEIDTAALRTNGARMPIEQRRDYALAWFGKLLDTIDALRAERDAALARVAAMQRACAMALEDYAHGYQSSTVEALRAAVATPSPDVAAAERAVVEAGPSAEQWTEACTTFPGEEASLVAIDYTNWRGRRRWRVVMPESMPIFTKSQWHPGRQWLIWMHDGRQGERKQFAMKDIHAWQPITDEALRAASAEREG